MDRVGYAINLTKDILEASRDCTRLALNCRQAELESRAQGDALRLAGGLCGIAQALRVLHRSVTSLFTRPWTVDPTQTPIYSCIDSIVHEVEALHTKIEGTFVQNYQHVNERSRSKRSHIKYPWRHGPPEMSTRKGALKEIIALQIGVLLMIAVADHEIATRAQYPSDLIDQIRSEKDLFCDIASFIKNMDTSSTHDPWRDSFEEDEPSGAGTTILRNATRAASIQVPDDFAVDAGETTRALNFEAEFRRFRTDRSDLANSSQRSREQQQRRPQRRERRTDRDEIKMELMLDEDIQYLKALKSYPPTPDAPFEPSVSGDDLEQETIELRAQVYELREEQARLQMAHEEEVVALYRKLRASGKKARKLEAEVERLNMKLEDAEELWSG